MKLSRLLFFVSSTLLAFSSSAFYGRDVRINDMDCYYKIGKVQCAQSGYWRGRNSARCHAKVSYRDYTRSRRKAIGTVTGWAYEETNTGIIAWMTLGLSDAILNQGNALAAASEARREVTGKIRDIKNFIPKCR
jgi:hypothetical protein